MRYVAPKCAADPAAIRKTQCDRVDRAIWLPLSFDIRRKGLRINVGFGAHLVKPANIDS